MPGTACRWMGPTTDQTARAGVSYRGRIDALRRAGLAQCRFFFLILNETVSGVGSTGPSGLTAWTVIVCLP